MTRRALEVIIFRRLKLEERGEMNGKAQTLSVSVWNVPLILLHVSHLDVFNCLQYLNSLQFYVFSLSCVGCFPSRIVLLIFNDSPALALINWISIAGNESIHRASVFDSITKRTHIPSVDSLSALANRRDAQIKREQSHSSALLPHQIKDNASCSFLSVAYLK